MTDTTQNTDRNDDAALMDFIAEMNDKPAQITLELMDKLEARWRETMAARRFALVMLTNSFSFLRDKVQQDDEFAVAVAGTYACVDDAINVCKGALEMLEASKIWMMTALAGRQDMEILMARGRREAMQ